MQRHTLTITTNADGDATGRTAVVNGVVHAIVYVKSDYANGVDFDATGDVSGIVILAVDDANASATYFPNAISQDTAAATVTFDGTNEVYQPIPVCDEAVKIVVDAGGDTKSGTFHVYVGS